MDLLLDDGVGLRDELLGAAEPVAVVSRAPKVGGHDARSGCGVTGAAAELRTQRAALLYPSSTHPG